MTKLQITRTFSFEAAFSYYLQQLVYHLYANVFAFSGFTRQQPVRLAGVAE